MLTGLNMVELASLNMVVDRLEHGWAGQLEYGCWQTWTWLSWSAWIWLLTGSLMHIGTDSSWVDEWTDLHNVVGTIMINKQPRSCMIEHVVREWWNNTIGQWCYNNHKLGCCVKSGFGIIPNIREQTLSIRQAVSNMLKDDWMFYHANSCYKVVEQTAL